MAFVSVIILNWNGKYLLEECINSLKKQTYPHFEVIVVDNGSTDGSISFVEQHAPHVKLVKVGENKGFSGGNMQGLRVAKGEYIALLNNDAVATPEWLYELVLAMEKDRRVGICASKVIRHDEREIIDSAGDGCVTSAHGVKRGNGESVNAYRRREYIFGACAAAVLYKKKMIEDIGFLDEDFFLNCEDTDLNFRAQLMGWKCLYVPSAIVFHKVSATIGRLSDRAVYHSARNEEYVWIKNMPTSLMFRYLHHKLIQEIAVFIYVCIRWGKWMPFFRGKIDAFKNLPKFLRKRREIQSKKRVTDQYIKTMLIPLFDKRLTHQKLKRLFSFETRSLT